jgi:hypothetical protein
MPIQVQLYNSLVYQYEYGTYRYSCVVLLLLLLLLLLLHVLLLVEYYIGLRLPYRYQ